MPKIVFNNSPKASQPFPFKRFDNELDLENIKLSSISYNTGLERSNALCIDLGGHEIQIAEISLYHSGNLFNFEQTFESSEILVKEIVKRFNSFAPSGQQILDFTKKA